MILHIASNPKESLGSNDLAQRRVLLVAQEVGQLLRIEWPPALVHKIRDSVFDRLGNVLPSELLEPARSHGSLPKIERSRVQNFPDRHLIGKGDVITRAEGWLWKGEYYVCIYGF